MFTSKVKAFIEEQQLFQPRETLLVAVSGGVDSLTLLNFLHQQSNIHHWKVIAVHVDHMFRGEDSYHDYLFVEQYCQQQNIPFFGKRINVPQYIQETGKNTQLAARECRYQYFQEVMEATHANKLVLGHHLDDQLETMLMHMVRGVTNPIHIGMPTSRPFATGFLVRPFLAVTRQEIEAESTRQKLTPREDQSNECLDYTRNRFRKNIVPMVKTENDQVAQHFQQLYNQISEDEHFLNAQAESVFASLEIKGNYPLFEVSKDSLKKLARPLQRRILQLILNYLNQMKLFSFSHIHIEEIIALINSDKSSQIHQMSSELYIASSFGSLLFSFQAFQETPFQFNIQIPGKTFLPNGDYLEANIQAIHSFEAKMAEAENTLIIRNKLAGDKVKLLNQPGKHKKLKKLFLEKRIPFHLRDNWPVVIASLSKEIVWIPGVYIDREDPSFPVIHTTEGLESTTIKLVTKNDRDQMVLADVGLCLYTSTFRRNHEYSQ